MKNGGKSKVEQLSNDLQTEHPCIRGFSARNIWRMKTFYEVYKDNEFLPPLVAEIGWMQNCLILEKCKYDVQREYIRKTKQMGWSKANVIDKLNKNHFDNQSLAPNNFDVTVSPELKAQVAWEFVGDCNIELLNPDLPISEKELENAIVTNIVKFLSEMDGLKYVIPMSCKTETITIKGVETLFGKEDDRIVEKPCSGCENKTAKNHNGIKVKIMDWKEGKIIEFVEMVN